MVCDQPESPNEGECLRYMLNRNRHMRGGVLQTYDEPQSPNGRGVFNLYDESE